MDNFFLKKGLIWIPYNKFTNVVYIDKGGFGTIYKATWLYNNKEVVFKSLNDFDEKFNNEVCG
jgi:hypothetical protein